jgi:hypothetical protein
VDLKERNRQVPAGPAGVCIFAKRADFFPSVSCQFFLYIYSAFTNLASSSVSLLSFS